MAKKQSTQQQRFSEQTNVETFSNLGSSNINGLYNNDYTRVTRGTTEYGDTIATGYIQSGGAKDKNFMQFYYNNHGNDSIPTLWIKEGNGKVYRSNNGIIDPLQFNRVQQILDKYLNNRK